MESKKRGSLIVLSGPSGVGKGTILKRIIGRRNNLKLSISYTTRKPREGEVNGKEYYFVTREEFMNVVKDGGMLEYAEYCGNYYGTPKELVEKELDQGNNVILEIEVQGAKQVRESLPQAIGIFILPPSLKSLVERLNGRALDSSEDISKRLGVSKQEIGYVDKYHYVVVNDIMDECASNILKIIDSESMKIDKMKHKINEVIENA